MADIPKNVMKNDDFYKAKKKINPIMGIGLRLFCPIIIFIIVVICI